jgi:hypothetical protein
VHQGSDNSQIVLPGTSVDLEKIASNPLFGNTLPVKYLNSISYAISERIDSSQPQQNRYFIAKYQKNISADSCIQHGSRKHGSLPIASPFFQQSKINNQHLPFARTPNPGSPPAA